MSILKIASIGNYNAEILANMFGDFTVVLQTTLGEMANPIDTLNDTCGVFKNDKFYDFESVYWLAFTEQSEWEKRQKEKIANLIEGLNPNTPIYFLDCFVR